MKCILLNWIRIPVQIFTCLLNKAYFYWNNEAIKRQFYDVELYETKETFENKRQKIKKNSKLSWTSCARKIGNLLPCFGVSFWAKGSKTKRSSSTNCFILFFPFTINGFEFVFANVLLKDIQYHLCVHIYNSLNFFFFQQSTNIGIFSSYNLISIDIEVYSLFYSV